jgi:hypothetical protein
MFVESRARHDWDEIRAYYLAGNSPRDCRTRFQITSEAWAIAVSRGDIVLRAHRPKPRGRTTAAVQRLVGQGLSQAAIARELGVSKPTVCFHMRKLGVPARTEPALRYDWTAIRDYYVAGHSATECQKRFGFSRNAWADAIDRGAIEPRPRLEPLDEILAAGRRRSRDNTKLRLLTAGLKHRRCEACGLVEWLGQPIALQLHHINGDGRDNRLQNLVLLCPNCHSQTDTWGARNKGRLRAPEIRGAVA